MPLCIENNYNTPSLLQLQGLQRVGYSVLRSPHVGNLHPSNLVCAALGFPLEMVSFTRGSLDVNYHPHVVIKGGTAQMLTSPRDWTPFARTEDGRSVTDYHQSAVKQAFSGLAVLTDMEQMNKYPCLAATVLRATNVKRRDSVWYRRVSPDGVVTKGSVGCLSQVDLETNVFAFSNHQSGWVVPNKVHMIFDFVYQSLSSGRDVIYHLSGPQMVEYVSKIREELEILYDAVRHAIPALPLTLRVRIVPVSSARFVTVSSRSDALMEFEAVRDQLLVPSLASWFVNTHPEFTVPIETATTLSQHDLHATAEHLVLSPWMLETPLFQVDMLYQALVTAAKNTSRAAE